MNAQLHHHRAVSKELSDDQTLAQHRAVAPQAAVTHGSYSPFRDLDRFSQRCSRTPLREGDIEHSKHKGARNQPAERRCRVRCAACARSACALAASRRHAVQISSPLTSVCCGWRHRLDVFVDSARAERQSVRSSHQEDRGGADRLSSTGELLATQTRSAPLRSPAAACFVPGATATLTSAVPALRNEQRPDPPSTRSPAKKPHARCAHVAPGTLDAPGSACSAQLSSPRHACSADTCTLRSQALRVLDLMAHGGTTLAGITLTGTFSAGALLDRASLTGTSSPSAPRSSALARVWARPVPGAWGPALCAPQRCAHTCARRIAE